MTPENLDRLFAPSINIEVLLEYTLKTIKIFLSGQPSTIEALLQPLHLKSIVCSPYIY